MSDYQRSLSKFVSPLIFKMQYTHIVSIVLDKRGEEYNAKAEPSIRYAPQENPKFLAGPSKSIYKISIAKTLKRIFLLCQQSVIKEEISYKIKVVFYISEEKPIHYPYITGQKVAQWQSTSKLLDGWIKYRKGQTIDSGLKIDSATIDCRDPITVKDMSILDE